MFFKGLYIPSDLAFAGGNIALVDLDAIAAIIGLHPWPERLKWKQENLIVKKYTSVAKLINIHNKPVGTASVGGSGGIPPGKFWNIEPRKCDFLRSERTFYMNFDFEIVIEIAKFLAKYVENLY